jgi:hypothetical protein
VRVASVSLYIDSYVDILNCLTASQAVVSVIGLFRPAYKDVLLHVLRMIYSNVIYVVVRLNHFTFGT